MTIIASIAGFFFKKSTEKGTVFQVIYSKYFYLGGLLYIICTLINIKMLKVLPYLIVIPLSSITYIWTMIIAYIYLKEKINIWKIIGVIFIFIGVFCIVL